ncbi:MAG: aryl-sulfate sulfotransferase [Gemmatimonadaceae bacterium]
MQLRIPRAATPLRALVTLSMLAVVACGAPTDVGGPRVLSAELSAPAPFVRTLHVELDRAAEVTVKYWTEGDSHLLVEAPASQSASLALTRLRPKRSYQYQVVGTSTSGTFMSDSVPTDLAASLVSVTGRRTASLLMLHLFEPTGFKGYAMLDEHDEVVWYWRTIEWRLGGMNGTYPLPVAEAFSGQHTPREIASGRVLMFDNGVNRGGYSRAVEYSLDGGTARTVWEWRSQPLNFAGAVGSARRLSNGSTMIAFGLPAGIAGSTGPTEVYEVNAAGTPVWHLITSTQTMYRAEPLTSVGAETVMR